MSNLNKSVQRRLNEWLSGEASNKNLNMSLRHLAKWRAQMLEVQLSTRSGDRVLSGPFKGMLYPNHTAEGARNPRLIGCYESCLAPVIEEIVARGYDRVVDIGCAEGYYAIGLALRMPGATIAARDTEPRARAACAELAAINGVADRVEIGGLVSHDQFPRLVQGRTLILCDIEGGEDELLDPDAATALRQADLLVEVHEGMKPGRLALLQGRFAESHEIRQIERKIDDSGLPDWAEMLGDLDRLLLLWEWRSTPTPWLWMRRKDGA